MPRLLVTLLLSLGIASSASPVTMEWSLVGDPGNACDPQSQGCFGAVQHQYAIGTYEVTNAQYAEFLNAKAIGTDPLGLYHLGMGRTYGGITQVSSSGGGILSYVTTPGRESWPVLFINYYDALRFANWMNNGQGAADTETGSYLLLGGTPTPSNAGLITRASDATIVLPSEDEWYKAAYYDFSSASYFPHAMGSNAPVTPLACAPPGPAPNTANCGGGGLPTPVGSYTGSVSPSGTYDQSGNAFEWVDSSTDPVLRAIRGGAYEGSASTILSSFRNESEPANEFTTLGFRLALVPEPGTGLLLIAGMLGLAGWRRVRV